MAHTSDTPDRTGSGGRHSNTSSGSDAAPRVALLGNLGDFDVADGVSDPRGWTVVAADGTDAGKVHDLVVDTGAMRTRYLDITLNDALTRSSGERDVLIPVGAARLDDRTKHVVLNGVSAQQLAALPAFTHGEITREYENRVLTGVSGRAAAANTSGAGGRSAAAGLAAGRPAAATDADYYATHHFDDSGLFGSSKGGARGDSTRITRAEEELDIRKREVQAGEVEVRKHVETEHVQRPVSVTREEVTIRRRAIPADRANAASTRIEEMGDEIRIPVIEEEVVVEKRPVVKEELVISKHAVTDNKTVEADLRKERVDIDRSDTGGEQSRSSEPNSGGFPA